MSRCLILMLAFAAVCRAAVAVTGADAASLITSDPKDLGHKPATSYTVAAEYYDQAQKAVGYTEFTIDEKTEWPDIQAIVNGMQHNLSSAAYNSLMALGKVAVLEGKVKWTGWRIDALQASTILAFRSLDTITLEDVDTHVSKAMSRATTTKDTRYYASGIFGVAAAQVDGKSIVSNAQDKLALYGLPQSGEGIGKVPFWDGNSLFWFYLSNLMDGKSITADLVSETSAIANNGIGLGGWKTPTEGGNKCDQTLVEMMTNSTWRSSHYVLTRYASGDDTAIHYTQIGDLSEALNRSGGGGVIQFVGTDGNGAYVGSGPVTNKVTFASASDSAVDVKVSGAGGDVTVTIGVYWKP